MEKTEFGSMGLGGAAAAAIENTAIAQINLLKK
jgi:hypothetical protein